ncbi:DinB family protein [Ornithinibacillus halotolerans]|uniref:DinB-like domain-containing protein n=1 Tax=Ornithinibacillus halotolerans TaxID=1274357 RepID=A0A916W720_9BACI|nr:DinB family protein [Ornithinibacillus halotolerans]GGA71873.1 hypothetical protein GCM10008025_14610 [Ornithinibacillus halotolerans]
MNFNFQESIQILERTPKTLQNLLTDISPEWYKINEGEGTWTPLEVIEHLIEGEKTDWLKRTEKIINPELDNMFEEFNRFTHLAKPVRKIEVALEEFATLRAENLSKLINFKIKEEDLDKVGIHPEFGEVTLQQLLATWVVHDLTHISQIVRVMANRYKDDVGPWISYLSILQK